MKGLGKETVLNHVSMFNYGTPFVDNPVEHNQPSLNSELQDNHSIPSTVHKMDWFLKKVCFLAQSCLGPANSYKGADIVKSKPITHEFFYPIWNRDGLKRLQCNILYSDTVEAEEMVGPGD
jgi:hypothetical protein